MNQDRVKDKFKKMIDDYKEDTLTGLLANDKDYKEALDAVIKAEKAYKALELSEEQYEVISELLALTDSMHMEYATLSYIAGVKDALSVLRSFDFMR